ncbi:hypothetical protein L1987_00035 [Smallanthus sonchifolius]|uniref:Uncharacterized protein n=1 Tax=Smallanthus sonchifolius TaxID=185202 RepID=A0ACB9K148_9ASTR|nr:hypothetical protein L1987_00035 [Smallanthus sonchifolius]
MEHRFNTRANSVISPPVEGARFRCISFRFSFSSSLTLIVLWFPVERSKQCSLNTSQSPISHPDQSA